MNLSSSEESQAADDAAERLARPHGERRLLAVLMSFAWFLNLAILAGAGVWIGTSGSSRHSIESLQSLVAAHSIFSSEFYGGVSRAGAGAIVAALVVAGATLVMMLGSLFLGSARFRSIRYWFFFTALLAGWICLLATWPEIYWRGQQVRVGSQLSSVAPLADKLQAEWPREDGELAGVGSFLAYPKDSPATLLMLGESQIPGATIRFSAVERTPDGALRFELAGKERGAWLEYRPTDSLPSAYTGGLQTRYEVVRYDRIAPHWFLVRYAHAPASAVDQLTEPIGADCSANESPAIATSFH
jgi:hypothetical protein